MDFSLVKIAQEDIPVFKRDMQEAFQCGFEEVYGSTEGEVLPEKDIDGSLSERGAIAYKALLNGDMVGGAIVVIDGSGHNHLHFLYVKRGIQSRGVGYSIWQEIERLHPETEIWETCTPCFERRNIHFYVNKCGFHIVEFQHERNSHEQTDGDFIGDGGAGMFVFQKRMCHLTK